VLRNVLSWENVAANAKEELALYPGLGTRLRRNQKESTHHNISLLPTSILKILYFSIDNHCSLTTLYIIHLIVTLLQILSLQQCNHTMTLPLLKTT